MHVAKSVYHHIKLQHGKYECDFCPYFCEMANNMCRHKKLCGTGEEHLTAINIKCSECERTFRTRRLLHLHRNSDHACNFKCSKCPAQYYLKSALRLHLLQHKFRKIRCLVCEKKVFATMDDFNAHLKVAHANPPVGCFCCSFCGKTYGRRMSLINHFARKHSCQLGIMF